MCRGFSKRKESFFPENFPEKRPGVAGKNVRKKDAKETGNSQIGPMPARYTVRTVHEGSVRVPCTYGFRSK